MSSETLQITVILDFNNFVIKIFKHDFNEITAFNHLIKINHILSTSWIKFTKEFFYSTHYLV